MTVIAGEIPALVALKTSFERQSDTVEQLMSTLSAELHNVYWRGGAADRFRSAWEGEYKPALRNLSVALVEAAAEVGQRAARLEEVGS